MALSYPFSHLLLAWILLLAAVLPSLTEARSHPTQGLPRRATLADGASVDELVLGQPAPPWRGWLVLQASNATGLVWITVPPDPNINNRPKCLAVNGIFAPATTMTAWYCSPDFRLEYVAVPVAGNSGSKAAPQFQLQILTGSAIQDPYCVAADVRGGCVTNGCTVADRSMVGIWPCSEVGVLGVWSWEGSRLRLSVSAASTLAPLYLVVKYQIDATVLVPPPFPYPIPPTFPQAYVVSTPNSTEWSWSKLYAASHNQSVLPVQGSSGSAGDRLRLKLAVSLPASAATGSNFGENSRTDTYRTMVLAFYERSVCWELMKLDLSAVHPSLALVFEGTLGANTANPPLALELFTLARDYAASGCNADVNVSKLERIVSSPASYYLELRDASGPDYTISGQLGVAFNVSLSGANITGLATVTVGLDFVCLSGVNVSREVTNITIATLQPPSSAATGVTVVTLIPNRDWPGVGLLACNASSKNVTSAIRANPSLASLTIATLDAPQGLASGSLTPYNTTLPPLMNAPAPVPLPLSSSQMPTSAAQPSPSIEPSNPTSTFPVVGVAAAASAATAALILIGLCCVFIVYRRRKRHQKGDASASGSELAPVTEIKLQASNGRDDMMHPIATPGGIPIVVPTHGAVIDHLPASRMPTGLIKAVE